MSMKEIQQRSERLQAMGARIARETDGNLVMQLAEEMRREAEELERVGLAFQAKMSKEAKRARGAFEVVLTPDQRQRIRTKTGVDMETVIVDDSTGKVNAAMTMTKPAQIELYAMQIAERRKLEKPAKERARREVEQLLADLEAQGEAMAERVRDLRKTPQFREILEDKKK